MKKTSSVFFLSLLLFALIVGLPTFADKKGETASRTVSLIIAAGPEQAGFDQLAPTARRYREVTINELALIPGAVAPGDRIAITPFLNESYVAVIDRASVDINKTLSLRGRLEGTENGYLLLSCSMGQVLASISVPDGNRKYQIIYNPALKSHFIRDLVPQIMDELPDSPSPIPPLPGQGKGDGTPPPLNATMTIDVMVVYTPAAKTWANTSGGGINNVINQAVQNGQLALDNSVTDMTIQLVHSAEIAYTESGDSSTDLDRLTDTSDGYMDSVHQSRNTYGADLVDLLTYVEDTGGIGWLLNTTAGSPDYAFSISRVQQAGWAYTVIHEMGHNMGCHHRKDQAVQPGPGLYSYSAGWRWVDATGTHCSVMSYEEVGSRVAHFSNPSITYQGVATGDAVDGDNARGLRNIKGVISNYRQTILGKEDFLGTWDGQGVYYRNSDTGTFVGMASPATMIACGDLYGDGIDDLIGVWPSQSGVWVKNSSNGSWIKISYTSAKHIASGDMNGDGEADFIGTWDGYGVQYRNSASGEWVTLATPATLITAGDLDGDKTDDLIGIWPAQGGVWVKYTSTGKWAKLSSTAIDIAAGDMNGDGGDELLATWAGQGVYYRNSTSGAWVKMASPASQVACGDLDADGKDDLIGIWPTQGGVWVKYSKTSTWAKLSTTSKDIAAGKMRSGTSGSAVDEMLKLINPVGGNAEGPESLRKYEDQSYTGPGGGKYIYQREGNLVPQEQTSEILKIPGPGEPGFKCVEEKNLFPVETKNKK